MNRGVVYYNIPYIYVRELDKNKRVLLIKLYVFYNRYDFITKIRDGDSIEDTINRVIYEIENIDKVAYVLFANTFKYHKLNICDIVTQSDMQLKRVQYNINDTEINKNTIPLVTYKRSKNILYVTITSGIDDRISYTRTFLNTKHVDDLIAYTHITFNSLPSHARQLYFDLCDNGYKFYNTLNKSVEYVLDIKNSGRSDNTDLNYKVCEVEG